MKKIALFLSVSFILLLNSGCLKDDSCNAKTVESEQAAIVNYALANGMTTTAHSSGLHYQVINAGSGPAPTITGMANRDAVDTGRRNDKINPPLIAGIWLYGLWVYSFRCHLIF